MQEEISKVLVLGNKGQLGFEVEEYLSSRGYSVVGMDYPELDVLTGDGRDALIGYLREVSAVVNCIAFTDVDKAQDPDLRDAVFRINADFPGQLSRACAEAGVVLIHISTDYVFSGHTARPYREADTPAPLNVYGASKLEGEVNALSSGDKVFVFRCAGLYGVKGPRGKGANFIDTIISLSQDRDVLKVVDDQITSPTSCSDVARAIERFLREGMSDYGIYHCTNSGAVSWYGLARFVLDTIGWQGKLLPVGTKDFPRPAPRPAYSALDNTKIRSVVEMRDWQDAVEEYLRRKYPERLLK